MTPRNSLRVHWAYLLRRLALRLARTAQALVRAAERVQPPLQLTSPRAVCGCAACRELANGLYVQACRRNALLQPGGKLRGANA